MTAVSVTVAFWEVWESESLHLVKPLVGQWSEQSFVTPPSEGHFMYKTGTVCVGGTLLSTDIL